jgi:hypothetical protein
MYLIIDTLLKYKLQALRTINYLPIKLKNKIKNKFIVSGSLYIGIVLQLIVLVKVLHLVRC